MLRQLGNGADLPATETRLRAWQDLVSGLVDALVHGERLASLGAERVEVDEVNQRLGEMTVEARRIESVLVRRIAELERVTARILDLLRPRKVTGFKAWLMRRLARGGGGSQVLSDADAAGRLEALLLETNDLLDALDRHRDFLTQMLHRCEPLLEEGMLRLRALTASDAAPQPDKDEALQTSIDLMQELVERLIGILSGTNLLANKLAVDAEERVLALSGLRSGGLGDRAQSMPKLAVLLHRAERGVLSVGALGMRKDRIDDAFRRRLAASRQVAT